MITFCLIVNRQCQSRFARYYGGIPKDRSAFERDVARRCIIRKPGHCHFFSTDDVGKIVFRRYASLYFIFGCDSEENEFALLELIQNCVETMDAYFENVTELDLLCNLEKVHWIMDDIVAKGLVGETNRERILEIRR
ncbi:hypothetical protein VTP01DRAFT_9857, partial [Rhizomucor pusillus]|uniref:uncharacterized protein n=1 Tax=Rhizomucor pusillus TaxID=4840 RepID=UPI003743FC07